LADSLSDKKKIARRRRAKNILSTYNKELQITDAVVKEAQDNVPGKYWDYRTNNLMYATPGNHPDDIDYATVAYGKAFPESPTVDSYFLRFIFYSA
jgi:hypothetical protein